MNLRLAKDTGGIYFLLPSEETMRISQREKAYSMTTLKEYVPDYTSRAEYSERRQKSELRRTLREIIEETKPDGKSPAFKSDHHFPTVYEQFVAKAMTEGPRADQRVQEWVQIEKRCANSRCSAIVNPKNAGRLRTTSCSLKPSPTR